MASVKKVEVHMRGMAAVAAVVVMMMAVAVAVAARPAKLKDISRNTSKLKETSWSASEDYVYPYWSFSKSPAELGTGYYYIFATMFGEGMAPEYDETNATYYVRLASSEAKYAAVTESSADGTLLVNSTVYIYNVESQRALAWRQEGTDEYFLIEQEVSSVTDGAPFHFQLAEGVALPCPLIYPPAQCHAYYLISNPTAGASSDSGTSGVGLQAYEESSVTYIKAAPEGDLGDLPVLLTTASSSITTTTTSAMPFPTIRSVTARE